MKKTLAILLLTLLLQNCKEVELKNGGQFTSQNNNLFYALWISSEMDSIQFFVVDEWSMDIPTETLAEKQNHEISVKGTINVRENEIFITELESVFLPSQRPKLKSLIIKNGKIYVDCDNITTYVWGRNDLGNCKSEQIEFRRMKE